LKRIELSGAASARRELELWMADVGLPLVNKLMGISCPSDDTSITPVIFVVETYDDDFRCAFSFHGSVTDWDDVDDHL